MTEDFIPMTEATNPNSLDLDLMGEVQFVEVMNRSNAEATAAVEAIRKPLSVAVAAVRDAFLSGGRLIYVGAGTSGRLGVLDASECPPTFSTDPGQVVGVIAGGERALRHPVEQAEDNPNQGIAAIVELQVTAQDVVCGIAASGRTPYVRGALEEARRRSARTLLVTCSPGSPLQPLADIPLVAVTGPEILAGSTRLKAGTATKLILNALTTGGLALSGKVYSNRMVDLKTSNHKLVDRGQRMLQELLGIDIERAKQLLDASRNQVKVALLMGVRNLTRDRAEQELKSGGGFLRKTLQGGTLATLQTGCAGKSTGTGTGTGTGTSGSEQEEPHVYRGDE